MKRIYKILLSVLITLLIPAYAFSAQGIGATCLTGGTTGCLDAINGAVFSDGDTAFVSIDKKVYIYRLDEDSGLTESSPSIIAPDASPGDKRWILQSYGPFNLLSSYGNSLSAAATAIGTATETTLYIDQTVTVAATLDLTTYDNITLEFINAGILSVSAGQTLTIYSPAHIKASPNQQIFTGSGTAAFSVAGDISPGWYGFSVSATGANNATYFGNMITGMVAGSTVTIDPGSYTIAGNLTISKACKVLGDKATFTWASDTTASRGLLVTASNVEIEGLTLDGPQHATYVGTQVGIYAYGADASNYISGLKIRNCKITDFSIGIQTLFVRDFEITGNEVYDVHSVGMSIACTSDGRITNNHVQDIAGTAGGFAYGIAITRTAGAIATYPRSANIVVNNNTIDNVSLWQGLNTHSGQRITFQGNTIRGCLWGIAVGSSEDDAGDDMFAPLDVSVLGNIIESGVTNGTYSQGISFCGAVEGAVVNEYATGSIIGNVISGHGTQGTVTSGGIIIYVTQGLQVSGNTIYEPAPNGIHLYYENDGISVVGNTIMDAWSTAGTGRAIFCNAGTIKGLIDANSFVVGSKVATSVMAQGIRIDNDATNDIVIGENYSEATDYLSGTLTYTSFGTRDGGVFLLKHVFTYADYPTGTTPNSDWPYVFPAGTVITDVWWTLDTEFSGGTVSAATLEFGVSGGDVDGLFPAENVFTGAGTGYKDSAVTSRGALLYSAAPIPIQLFCAAATNLRTTLRTTGEGPTAGQATIWVKGYRVK